MSQVHTVQWCIAVCVIYNIVPPNSNSWGIKPSLNYAQPKKVSSRLTIFYITREIFDLICSFKILHKDNSITHNLSGHSLQFIVIPCDATLKKKYLKKKTL